MTAERSDWLADSFALLNVFRGRFHVQAHRWMDALEYHYSPVYTSMLYTGKTPYLLCYNTSSFLLCRCEVSCFSRAQIILTSAGNAAAAERPFVSCFIIEMSLHGHTGTYSSPT